MYDKQVRRRRAVLVALVLCCLVLVTAYFGESSGGGPLHSLQRGTMEVLAPVQEGANRVLKPLRDMFGWFGDTLDAKDERDRLKAERDALRQQVARLQMQAAENEELKGLLRISREGDFDRFDPVTARVYNRSASTWYSTVQINKGSSDGVAVGQPVVNGEGLVGKVKSVSDGNAVVMLLTDQDFGVSAHANEADEPGAVTPAVGGDLMLDLVPRAKLVRKGDRIITAGTISDRLPSVFPRGILIGTVSKVEGDGELDRAIHVAPAANLRRLDFVRVLTGPTSEADTAASERASAP